MLREPFATRALKVIHFIFVRLRDRSYGGAYEGFAEILDNAEYLVVLMLDTADQTEAFRAHLAALVAQCPDFEHALDCFDRS